MICTFEIHADTLERAKAMWGWKRPRGKTFTLSSSGSSRTSSATATANKRNSLSIGNSGGNANSSTRNVVKNNRSPGNLNSPAVAAAVAAESPAASQQGAATDISTSRHSYCPITRFKAAAAERATVAANQVDDRTRWEEVGVTGRSMVSRMFGGAGAGKGAKGATLGVATGAGSGGSGRGMVLTARGGGGGVDLTEGAAWEQLRTARFFASWMLEAALLYLAIRMMLW